MGAVDKLVYSMSIDKLVNTVSGAILMKIDVQGYELKVLKSAEHFILQHRPHLIIEFEEHHLKRMTVQKGSDVVPLSTTIMVEHLREILKYEVFQLSYPWPSDHIAVPVEKLY